MSQSTSGQLSSYIAGSYNGVVEVIVSGDVPVIYRTPVAIPGISAVMLDNCPAYTWSFGCANTAAAMAAGYYDNHGYPEVYTGISNEGIMPMDNSMWGTVLINGETRFQCPLSATMAGLDERTMPGHVDDFWINYNHFGPDPFIVNGSNRHVDGDCTGDFMGSSQSLFANADGMTRFFFLPDGSPLHNYSGNEPLRRDGCYGIRLFYESRLCQVLENYTQLIPGIYGNSQGFSFLQFCEEIDNGRPVIIQLAGHCVLGVGYDADFQLVYVHDTWDYALHSMTWGAQYAGMQQWGVTVIRLWKDNGPPQTEFTASSIIACKGEPVQLTDQSLFSPEEWLWTFDENPLITSSEQNPVVSFNEAGIHAVSLQTSNQYGYDTKTVPEYFTIINTCYCNSLGSGDLSITEFRLSTVSYSETCKTGTNCSLISGLTAVIFRNVSYPVLLRVSNVNPSAMSGAVYFDWNADFDFLDDAEQVILNNSGDGYFTGLILVPASAITGLSRLRIIVGEEPAIAACGNIQGGSADCLIEILGDESLTTSTVRLFPEGMFNYSNNQLNQARNSCGTLFQGDIADLVTIEFWSSDSPHSMLFSFPNLALSTSGFCVVSFSESIDGEYYIVVRHRNSLTVCSADPCLTGGNLFDFTLSDQSVLGNYLVPAGNYYLVPTGDSNQDGCIDETDMNFIENAAQNFENGYNRADVNADGLVDALDMILTDLHAAAGRCSQLPHE